MDAVSHVDILTSSNVFELGVHLYKILVKGPLPSGYIRSLTCSLGPRHIKDLFYAVDVGYSGPCAPKSRSSASKFYYGIDSKDLWNV